MQVHEVRIGEHDLDQAKRIVRARILHELVRRQARRPVLVPVDRMGIHFAPAAVEHADVHALQRAGVAPQLGQLVLDQDARRNGPGRIEHDVGDLRAEDRRFALVPADDDFRRPDGFIVAEVAHVEAGDVDQHELAFHLVQGPATALEIDSDLVDPLRDRHVHRGARARTDRTVRRQAMTFLERLDRLLERRVVEVGIRGCGCPRRWRQVPRNLQPLAQHRHARVAHAGLQRGAVRNARPAASRSDCTVFLQAITTTLIPGVRRSRAVEGYADFAGGETRREALQSLVERWRRALREVPLRAQLDRIHLADEDVVEPEHEGVGREQFEVGAILQRQRRLHAHVQAVRAERFDVVVVGIETVVAQVFDACDEFVEPRRVLPGRLELLRLVVLCDQLVER